jgi:hypothetical protein
MKYRAWVIICLMGLSIARILPTSLPAQKFVIGAHCHCGFFAVFMRTLSMVDWARRKGKEPVVYWGAVFPYYQQQGYFGEKNGWNYYFQPISKIAYQSGDTVYQSPRTPDDGPTPENIMTYDETFHNDLKWHFHEVIKNNIRIQPRILKRIWNFYVENMSGKTVIGIHLRGTDKHVDATPVDPEAIFAVAKQIAEPLGNSCRFFIATDEARLLDLAKEKLGADKVLSYNSERSEDGQPVHLAQAKKGKPLAKAVIGEQVLIEAQLLSKCTYFLHTTSNVATAVMLFNPRIHSVFFCQDKDKGLLIRSSNFALPVQI